MAPEQAPRARETAPAPSRWRRVQEFLSAAAVILSIIGGAAVVVGGGLYLWVTDLRGFATTVVAMGGALLALALASSFVAVRRVLTGQRGRYAANAILMVLAFVAIAVLLNFITYSSRLRLDTTATKQFNLAAQTLQVLQSLKEPVKATAFFNPAEPTQRADRQLADDLMFEFQRRSERAFTYEFVDPDLDPSVAREKGVTDFPAIYFRAADSGRGYTLMVPPLAEQDLTSALLIVTGERQKPVYFLTGHGEKSPADVDPSSEQGYGLAARGLLSDGYLARTVNLSQAGAIPSDMAALVIAGPTRDLAFGEKEVLLGWLKDGGRLLLLLDPRTPEGFLELLAPWALSLQGATIVDQGSSLHGDPRSPLIQRSQFATGVPITRQMDAALMSQAAPILITLDPKKLPPWIQYQPLATTTFLSWATTDPERNAYQSGQDTLGPHVVGMAVTALSTADQEPRGAASDSPATGIVVFGDSDFAGNKFYAYSTNRDLFLNSVNWLAQDYHLISIRPKPFAFRALVVTRSEFDFIRYTSWFVLPTALALMGLAVWWRRR